jgi:hypothetical protein
MRNDDDEKSVTEDDNVTVRIQEVLAVWDYF